MNIVLLVNIFPIVYMPTIIFANFTIEIIIIEKLRHHIIKIVREKEMSLTCNIGLGYVVVYKKDVLPGDEREILDLSSKICELEDLKTIKKQSLLRIHSTDYDRFKKK